MDANLPAVFPIKKPSNQKGSSLLLAIFIIVVVMLLGASLVELLSTGNEGVAQEVLGTRALAAANSGMQGQLQILFPLNGAVGTCPVVDTLYDFSDVTGLYNCDASVSCNNYVTDSSTGIHYYRLVSTGSCGTGTMEASSQNIVLSSRTIQVDARGL